MIFYPMARTKSWRAHLRARQMCAQLPVLKKIVKNRICGVTHMARGARGSARAPKIISDLNSPSKIDAF